MGFILELKDTGLDEEALGMVVVEDIRQIEKYGYSNHSLDDWHLILQSEMGDLSRSILRSKFQDAGLGPIARDAIHVATVALKIARMLRELSK